MQLNHLRVFFEVAKAGQFVEAAKRLNISQSALSRSVAILEDEEGVKLLERSKSGVALTPIGAEVFRQCEQLFQVVRKIEDVCKGVQTECEGPLYFATTDNIATYLLPKLLKDFRLRHEKVLPRISIGTPDANLEKLLLTDCEFTIALAKIEAPQVEFEALRREPMALVVERGLWQSMKGVGEGSRLSRLLKSTGYIASVGAQTGTRPSRVLKELFGTIPPIAFEVDGQEAQKQICLAGGGVAYLARFMVADEIASGRLHEIEVGKPHEFKLWVATRRGKELSLPARTFLDELREIWR